MKASVIAIGDELLIGQVIDTNSAWIGRSLSNIGIQLSEIFTVGDDHNEIITALNRAETDSDFILITGGLGPTKDDITKKALADFLGVKLFFHEPTFERIKKMFESRGRVMSPSHHDQCLMPEGVKILPNRAGTAPGMLFNHKGKMIISMPGVPHEMVTIMQEEVLPILGEISDKKIFHRTILTACTGETIIEDKIADVVSQLPEYIKIAYLPDTARVSLRLSGEGSDLNELKNEVLYFSSEIDKRLGNIIYGYGEANLQSVIKRLCIDKKITVGTAESCTGGALAAKLVSVAGASSYFYGGVVSYTNELKHNWLDVSNATLEKYGAVSEQTVIEMVNGGLNKLHTDLIVSISGIAGPDGGSDTKPVGTIWIAVGNNENKEAFLLRAGKSRDKNIETAVIYAMDILRRFIVKHYM